MAYIKYEFYFNFFCVPAPMTNYTLFFKLNKFSLFKILKSDDKHAFKELNGFIYIKGTPGATIQFVGLGLKDNILKL